MSRCRTHELFLCVFNKFLVDIFGHWDFTIPVKSLIYWCLFAWDIIWGNAHLHIYIFIHLYIYGVYIWYVCNTPYIYHVYTIFNICTIYIVIVHYCASYPKCQKGFCWKRTKTVCELWRYNGPYLLRHLFCFKATVVWYILT